MTTRKYRTYQKLQMRLKSLQVPHAGVLATILLDAFVKGSGRLYADQIVLKGLCKEGLFKEWRAGLVSKGVIQHAGYGVDWAVHSAGPAIVDIINEEKLSTDDVVTRKEYLATIKRIIEKLDPPATDEKVAEYAGLVKRDAER